MIGKVEFFLGFNFFPGFINENWESVHRDVLWLDTGEESVRWGCVEPLSQFLTAFIELFFFELFVGEHAVLEVEEVGGLGLGEGFWFVDLRPNHVHVPVQNWLYHLEVVAAVIEVPQHEQKLLRQRLVEQLQVHLKDHTQQTQIRCSVPTNVLQLFKTTKLRLSTYWWGVHQLLLKQKGRWFIRMSIEYEQESFTILYSPLSLLSVPSMSKTRMLPSGLVAIHTPLVVCSLPFWKSIVSNFVSNNKFNRVPSSWISKGTYSSHWTNNRWLQRCGSWCLWSRGFSAWGTVRIPCYKVKPVSFPHKPK